MVKQGDVVWLDFDPQAGREQWGRRPALIVSNNTFNEISNIAIVCPISNTENYRPYVVKLDKRTKTTGIVLCNQIKSVDLKARKYEYIEKLPKDILEEIVDLINSFTEIE
jgi:mRNA interferase MazF